MIPKIVEKLHSIGQKVREVTLYNAMIQSESELIQVYKAPGDEEMQLDLKPAEILRDELDKFARKEDIQIEIVGEAVKGEESLCGTLNGEKYIVHVDVIDGTRESTHKLGLSFFEAGVLPWKENPVLSDTVDGVVVSIGYSSMGPNRLYSYFNDNKGSYSLEENSGSIQIIGSTHETEFNTKGFFDTITSFRGTGILTVLKDLMFNEMYGYPTGPDVFHREILTSAGEILNVVNGNTRGVMDLRPAVSLISKRLGISGYSSPAGLCMHPYDVSGIWPIIRDTKGPVIKFYDENFDEVKPETIQIRNVHQDLGYIACGNEELFKKVLGSLRKVLGIS